MEREKHKEVLLRKCWTLRECLKEYNKFKKEGRDVTWGQFPEGHYEVIEYLPIE